MLLPHRVGGAGFGDRDQELRFEESAFAQQRLAPGIEPDPERVRLATGKGKGAMADSDPHDPLRHAGAGAQRQLGMGA